MGTTIHSLPPEILIHILSLTVLGQHCLIQSRHSTPRVKLKLKNICGPDTLSRVCSLWRHIVRQFPSLWSHIDIALNHPLNPRLVARAKVLAAQAGSAPLDIHVFDPDFEQEQTIRRLMLGRQGRSSPNPPRLDPNKLCEFSFRLSTPMRIRSLNFNFMLRQGLHTCHMSALEYFLAKCTPGVLTHFSMQSHIGTLSSFVEPADGPQTVDSVLLDIPSQLFESIWLGTTTLRLNGLCPHWGSKAYHGLVELRIGKRVPRITEAQLVNILGSSPGLRVLHVTTAIEDLSSLDDSVVPIHLEDLEDLEVNDHDEMGSATSGEILRWIAPGPRPIRLVFDGYPSKEIISFCARSNVTRFFGKAFAQESVVEIIRRCSSLEILALNADLSEVRNLASILGAAGERGSVDTTHTTKVDTLYLTNYSVIPLGDLEDAVAEYSVQRLIIRDSSIGYDTDEGVKETSDPPTIISLLSNLKCPAVEYLEQRSPVDPDSW
ncbi:hypothetical protein RSOLAG1IB_09820 [Rhizoctonia solani AG-1 IB]|uniref:Uncharacterized protein n=1 Tax=Thanatephorus cucumeris (strain AG1-IB / isolate 7/3/14) TaxID=1108050 RepID=A0A0B7FY64_THACB|nr:hypothetical protein RSOLAG1IB_09820 [Rhizoctonia solani AG-1 IB]